MKILLVRQWLNLRLLLAGIVLIPLGGCGYQWVGQSSLLPKDAQTVYVEPFINRSRDIGLEKQLTSALRGEFYRRGQLRVVDESVACGKKETVAKTLLRPVLRPAFMISTATFRKRWKRRRCGIRIIKRIMSR
jgi:hypothetical protein